MGIAKQLTLRGAGADVVTVKAANPYNVFYVTADYVNISGFNATGATASYNAGICLTSADHCNISENTASNNSIGIVLDSSSSNTLTSNTNVSDPVFFVVYDPEGGHATGGGWFYPDGESTLPGGRADFGFTARYKDNSSTGKLNFQYKDADIHLKSTSIDWLTISAVSAQFQGTGTINGEGLYAFRVQAKDNGEPGAGSDYFDIKIWDGTDTDVDPYHKAKNVLSGGNIPVHKKV